MEDACLQGEIVFPPPHIGNGPERRYCGDVLCRAERLLPREASGSTAFTRLLSHDEETGRVGRISAPSRVQLGDASAEKAAHYCKINAVSPPGRHGQAWSPGQCCVAPEAGR